MSGKEFSKNLEGVACSIDGMPLVRYLSTRIAVLGHGKLVETGEAVEICAHPREAYTRQLIAATPELPVCAEN